MLSYPYFIAFVKCGEFISQKQKFDMSNTKILIGGLVITLGLAAFLFWPGNERNATPSIDENKIEVVMYKNPGCECCTKWATRMNMDQYQVIEKPIPTMMAKKQEVGVPARFESCHTAMVEGYFIEGHVPIEDVNRLLKEKPDALGLTVPGMPIGSPGMEVPGREADTYDVYLVKKDGSTEVYSSY